LASDVASALAPAPANVFAATAKRLRQLPLQKALKQA
jgi:hypothetical protein